MPLYEYRCTACGAQIEVIQSFRDKPRTRCEACGGRMEKLVSRSGFILKGGGWYETGFKTDQDKKRNLVEADKAESKSDDKTESQADT